MTSLPLLVFTFKLPNTGRETAMSPVDKETLTAPQRHRTELVPMLTSAFAKWGYRKATTARLAEHCGVQEVELYRVWPSKLDMFLAAIDHVFEQTQADWSRLFESGEEEPGASVESMAKRLLSHQSLHQGDRGFYRIIFAGLNELDEPEVRRALRRLYRRFHRVITQHVVAHRGALAYSVDDSAAARDAWGLVGLAAVCDIGRSLGLLGRDARRALMTDVGSQLLEDEP